MTRNRNSSVTHDIQAPRAASEMSPGSSTAFGAPAPGDAEHRLTHGFGRQDSAREQRSQRRDQPSREQVGHCIDAGLGTRAVQAAESHQVETDTRP
jgi:hypothetical protein